MRLIKIFFSVFFLFFSLEALSFSGGLDTTAWEARGLTPLADRTPKVRAAILESLGQRISQVSPEDLERITFLAVRGSVNVGLERLKEGDFDGLSSLTYLNLSGNDLASLPEGLFAGLSNITYIDLSDNNLSSLPLGVFEGLQFLQSINLSYNSRLSKDLLYELPPNLQVKMR